MTLFLQNATLLKVYKPKIRKNKMKTSLFCMLIVINSILLTSTTNANYTCEKFFELNYPDNLPADISFLSADIKIHNSEIKFCEIEDAVYNAIRKACYCTSGNVEISNSFYLPDWGIFSSFLSQFNLPIWYVGYIKNTSKQIMHRSLKNLHPGHINYFKTLSELENDTLFQQASNKKNMYQLDIKNYKGIIIYRETKKSNTVDSNQFKLFKSKYPEFLYVNNFIRKFISNKKKLYLLFQDASLQKFLPKFGIYKKTDSSVLEKQIKDEISSKFLIIKPINEIKSHGITMIKSEELPQTLSKILKKKSIEQKSNHQLNYWKNNLDTDFIVMEYVPSDGISYCNQFYDPTLRISFILYHTQNQFGIILQNCFWRLPPQPLQSNSSLTEQHITTPDSNKKLSGIYVDQKTINLVNNILPPILKQLYETALSSGTYE